MAERVVIKNGQYFQDIRDIKWRHPEVLFPMEFTHSHPWGDTPEDEWRNDRYPGEPVSIPIYTLSHVTHNEQAESIVAQEFAFLPKQKLGKRYFQEDRSPLVDGSPLGETYKKIAEDTYQEIPHPNEVFPGRLSWWGISTKRLYGGENIGRDFQQGVDGFPGGSYLPGYLQNPAESGYGNKDFSIDFKELLKAYRDSRAGSRKMYLRIGGTLRYRYEICYVIVVCMKEDLQQLQAHTKKIHEQDPELLVFEDNGMVSARGRGKICDLDSWGFPTFKGRNIVKYYRITHSWEQLVFAFYFPNNDDDDADQNLKCPPGTMQGMPMDINHPEKICTAKLKENDKWKCPNNANR